MRILDDRYKLFGIVNPVDLVVVLILVAGVFTVANLLFGKAEPVAVKDTVPIRFSVLYQGLPKDAYDAAAFVKGDTVSKVGGRPIGKLVSWSASPVQTVYGTETGLKVGEVPWGVDVRITVEGTAERTANGLLAGDLLIKDNLVTGIATSRFQGDGRIFGLSVEGQ